IEHHAVLHACQALEKQGHEVTYLPADEHAMINPKDLRAAMKENTALVSIMHANNEVGTIAPIKALAAIAHDHGALFHTDAVQTTGHIALNVEELGIDLLSISAHKFGGPKGVGALYIRKGTKVSSFIQGGAQEKNMRAGTENVAGIVGMCKALELAVGGAVPGAPLHGKISPTSVGDNAHIVPSNQIQLRDYAINRILTEIPNTTLYGHPTERLPNNINIGFEYIEGESLLLMLDAKGICASSGSACTSGALDPSHVLLAMGVPHEKAHGSLRLTLGLDTTKADIDYVIDELKPIVARLRAMSPLGH
ncbi:MAG: aminotransferase class V-fold PLP-dependent enzyme, partial [Oscillospiraceae bacterium]|nr:aminotransferase class V-fold PLP-dependent enzyme [Oscillospiraceae bacterium]